MDWDVKIVGHGKLRVDQLLHHPDNWRIHPAGQQDALTNVINEVGFVRSITVNRQTGHIVDGHLRAELADQAGVEEIDVEYIDVTPAQELLLLATLDPLSAMAAMSETNLEHILAEVGRDHEMGLQSLLDDLAARINPQADPDPPGGEGGGGRNGVAFVVVIDCASEAQANLLAERLAAEHYVCRVMEGGE